MKQKKIFPRQNQIILLKNRKFTDKLIKIPLFFTIAVFFFHLSAVSHAEGKDHGDAFVSASIADARTLIPILASDTASNDIVSSVFNGLVKYDKDLKLTGDLAESWEIKDDGLVIIFHLRKNVKWHDGTPFTAGDVKFTYEKLVDPDVPTPYSGDFKKVSSLEVLDAHTIKVTYVEPFSPGLASWGMHIMPSHILKDENFLTTEFSRNPIGTGPYRFKSWKTGERIDLVFNPDYFEHRPYIDRIIYRVIPDSTTMFLELETRNIDAMDLSPVQYKRLTDVKQFRKNFNKYRYPAFSYTYVGYNLQNDLFKDKRVRQAINYAIDKDEIIEGILLGYGEVCTGPFSPKSWAYNRNVKPFPFDKAKAGQLLSQAGWADSDGDGWLDKDGRKFEFTILTNQGNDLRIKSAEIIQRRLKDVGIKVNIRVLEWAVFINEFINKKRFEAVLLGWSLGLDPDCYDIWHSSKTRQGEFNFISYSNKAVDSLIEEGRRTFDIEKRKEIYARVHEIIYDEQPCLFLYVPDALVALSSRFKGVEPAAYGLMYNFIDWYVPKSEQRYKK